LASDFALSGVKTGTHSFTNRVAVPVIGLLLLSVAFDLRAATITVTNAADSGAGTLRAALASANNGDTINFALPMPAKITLTSRELLVTKGVNVLGPGPANLIVDGKANYRVFHVGSNTLATIAGLTVVNGRATNNSALATLVGGGILNDHATLTVSNCTLTGNQSRDGAGIYNWGGRLTVVNSSISGNSAGLNNVLNGRGGGIANDGFSAGAASLQVVNSLLSSNAAGLGGALANMGCCHGNASLQLINSTLSGNSIPAGGGAIANEGPSSGNAALIIFNSTLNGNSSGIYNFADGGGTAAIQVASTILNDGNEYYSFGAGYGTVTATSLGYNLSSGDGSGILTDATDLLWSDALLGPLQDNGGPTFTHALLCGSPAIDRGKNFSGYTTDQRGASRTVDLASVANAPSGDGTDIGAFEQQSECVPCSTSFTVTTISNSGPGSLRQAILDANSSGCTGTNTIEFAPDVRGTIRLTSGELAISRHLFVNGPGRDILTVDGGGTNLVFRIKPSSVVTIAGLGLTNGGGVSGGAIYNDHASLTVTNCILTGNTGWGYGGAISSDGGSGGSASLQIFNSILSSNQALSSGGCIFCWGRYNGNTSLLISNSILSGNYGADAAGCIHADGYDGGYASARIFNSTLSTNSAGYDSGCIFVGGDNGSSLEIVNSTLNGNLAGTYGGAIEADAALEVRGCTLSGNFAGSYGGGGIGNFRSAVIANTTLEGNSTRAQGGAIVNSGRGSLSVRNCTLSGNAAYSGGGIFNSGSASLELGSTILDGGVTGVNIANETGGVVVSLGFNLSSDDGGGFLTNTTDQINADPMLGPLQDNGGPTSTHALLCGSPAIDKGRNFTGLATDQRGLPRGFDDPYVPNASGGDGTDIGAFEFQKICNFPPVADAGAMPSVVISSNGTNATVILDASRSSDPDGDALQYYWFEHGTPLASGVVALTVLPVGTYTILLVVSDSTLSDTNAVTVEVITAAEAVNRLASTLSTNVSRAQPLLATMRAALASIDRSNPVSAFNQLQAFQNQVCAQVSPIDADVAASLLEAAQQIIDALSSGGTNPGGKPHGRFTSCTRQPNGHVTMQFITEAAGTYLIEASTNLVNWELVGVAAQRPDGQFEFEDPQTAQFVQRFYRVRVP
jgi:hypothetical protein